MKNITTNKNEKTIEDELIKTISPKKVGEIVKCYLNPNYKETLYLKSCFYLLQQK